MKLLFDQNLSHHLVLLLTDLFPGSCHVRQLGLERADDEVIWSHAAHNALTIVSKDSDFHQRSLVFGPPPKLAWLCVGNASTGEIERLVRERYENIRLFIESPDGAILVVQ